MALKGEHRFPRVGESILAWCGSMAKPSLYRRVLGDQFGLLAPALQSFHDSVETRQASGTFDVTRGAGRWRSWLATLLRLPPAGTNVPVTLEVVVDGDREQWVRRFDAHLMQTWQWQSGELLIEAGGPLRLGFELVPEQDRLRYRLRRAWFCLVPLPGFLAPRIEAIEVGREDGWEVTVRFILPVVGLLIQYQGAVRGPVSADLTA